MPDDEACKVASARLGQVLRGKYRLDRVLGIGGMATVYAATHRNKKRFAIKMLHPELSVRENIRMRFLREGYVANSVDHSGAVAVLDDDVAEDGSAFLVMELLDGSALDVLASKHVGHKLPVGLVLSTGDALLEVLAAAHAKGIVHRDLKPANVFLTNDGRLEVLDFGIARLHDETSPAEHATQTGAMLGTPAFMAPEQALAEQSKIDAQTDLWAVGATLFTLLSGALVHEGDNASQLMVRAATSKARSLATVAPEVPKVVADVIDRALAFEKRERWESAGAMREALAKACIGATGAPIAPLPTTERVTGLQATVASDPSGVQPAGENLGFEPTVDAGGAVSAMKGAATTGANLSHTAAEPSVGATPRAARARWSLVGAAALIVAGGTLGVRAFRGVVPPVASAPSAEPRPGRSPATPAAAAAFEAALQAEHDGNTAEIERSLDAAIASDPALGAAYLRKALVMTTDRREGEAHAAYQKAREHRATLGEIDAAILDAYEPRFRDPPDRAECTRRLEESAKRYPSNVAILAMLATSLTGSDRYDDAEKAADRALALDPHYVPAIEAKIRGARRVGGSTYEMGGTGDVSKIRQLADDCVKTCPAATVCLQERINLAHEDGRCADVKADARRWLAIDPASSPAYIHLADAIASLGEPIEAVAEAVRRADANVADPDKRRDQEFDSIVSLAELQGDFNAADKALSDREAFAASRPNLDPTGPAMEHVAVLLEEGEPARARALVSALRSRRIASGIGEYDFPIESGIAIVSMRAGLMTRMQWRAERQRLVALQAEADKRRGGTEDPLDVWGNSYWVAPQSADEAADALEELPKLGGVDETLVAGNKFPRQFGMTYVFAGRGAEAIPLLDRVTRSCRQYSLGLWYPVYWHALALAKEQTGDLAGAKVAYDRVLASWRNAKPRSVTADKARAGLARLANASPGAAAR